MPDTKPSEALLHSVSVLYLINEDTKMEKPKKWDPTGIILSAHSLSEGRPYMFRTESTYPRFD